MVEQIISFVMPLAYLVSTTASLVFLTKRNFGKCLPLTMMGSAFLLFFSQLVFGTFNVGFIIGILCSVASIGLGIWRRKEWDEYRKLLFSSGFVVFLTVYVLVFVYDFARGFSVWDEFSHWGMMLKEMLRLDKFYYIDASNLLVHKDYPPIMQLFELFWMKLCGGYSERFALRALHTFEFSLFIPFIADKIAKKKNVWKSIIAGMASVFSLLLIMVFFDQHGVVQTIYTDYALAMVVAFLLMTVLACKKVDWFEIVTIMVGGGFLLLLKQMGLPLYLMVICFFVGIVGLRKKEEWKSLLLRVGWKRLAVIIGALVVPFVIWLVWGRLVADTVKQFDLSEIRLTDFLKILLGHGEEWQSYTIKKYIMALGEENISTSFIQVSYLQSVVMFVLALMGVWLMYRKQLAKKEIVWLGGVLVCGALGYAATMMVLYVLSFSSYEATILASFNRYMGTYAMVMLLTVAMIVIWQAIKIRKEVVIYVMAMGLVLVNAPEAYSRVYPFIKGAETRYDQYAVMAENLRDTVEGDAKVFLIVQNSIGYYFYLQYYATPMKMNYAYATWIIGDNVDGKEYYEKSILPRIKDYDYLLVVDTDEEFSELYCSSLKICPIKDKSLYRIKKGGDGEVGGYELIKVF
ncbi:MAG: hypothetical protein Q4A79_00050 [Candidatus Saccharibacteria bacterium]|nr:hypothetical protein [Candidatus Saccharibacteria bacterium]